MHCVSGILYFRVIVTMPPKRSHDNVVDDDDEGDGEVKTFQIVFNREACKIPKPFRYGNKNQAYSRR